MMEERQLVAYHAARQMCVCCLENDSTAMPQTLIWYQHVLLCALQSLLLEGGLQRAAVEVVDYLSRLAQQQ